MNNNPSTLLPDVLVATIDGGERNIITQIVRRLLPGIDVIEYPNTSNERPSAANAVDFVLASRPKLTIIGYVWWPPTSSRGAARLNGQTIIKQVHRLQNFAGSIIVVLPSFMDSRVRELLQLGIRDVLVPPLDRATILPIVKREWDTLQRWRTLSLACATPPQGLISTVVIQPTQELADGLSQRLAGSTEYPFHIYGTGITFSRSVPWLTSRFVDLMIVCDDKRALHAPGEITLAEFITVFKLLNPTAKIIAYPSEATLMPEDIRRSCQNALVDASAQERTEDLPDQLFRALDTLCPEIMNDKGIAGKLS